MRLSMSLDGLWQFQIDPTGTMSRDEIASWREINVPGPWQSQFEDLRLTPGAGWYRRSVSIPSEWERRAVFLYFGAVDYFAEVWVNGQRAGEHEGGYLPFEFDISALAHYGADNEIVVRAVDPGKEADIFPQFQFADIPHGKQSWYGPIGGIWQSVKLEARAKRFIQQVHVTPQGLSGLVSASVRLGGAGESERIIARCLSPQGEVVATAEVLASDEANFEFSIPSPLLWELDSPALYTLEITLWAGDQPVDLQTARFGIRTFEARDGKLWLNGQILYLRGALDQDYYPEGIYTPPSLEFLRDQARLAKSMGLNCLRCHIKIADPRYLQAADEEGLLIWAEIPSWGKLSDNTWNITEAAGRRARETFAAMVARDWNHPSIVIWSIVNEDWGTNVTRSQADRTWLRETFDWARQIDPHRLIVDNSACFHNFHVKSDLDDYHFYAAMPDNLDGWQKFITDFAARPAWSYSPHGDIERTGKEPLLVSEFGNWGLPDIELLKQAYGGEEPWWFATGSDWGNPSVVLPHGAQERLNAAELNNVFGDWSGLARAAQWAQYRALKHEIEVMRAEPTIAGYVITEWTDLHWECNGLVDMARNPRVFKDRMREFNADTVIVPRWERLAYWSGETVTLNLLVAHHGTKPLADAVLKWRLEGTALGGQFEAINAASGEVVPAGVLSFAAPEITNASQYNLIFSLESPEQTVQNVQTLSIFPNNLQRNTQNIAVSTHDVEFASLLQGAGYMLDRAGLHIATSVDTEILEHVRNGGRALVFATQEGALMEGIEVKAREGTPWSGNWASSFAWIRPGITRIPGGPLLDFSWRGVIPTHVLTGVQAQDTLAGLFVGWLHLPAALAARISLGSGCLTLTTFPALASGNTPAQRVLLHDLIQASLG